MITDPFFDSFKTDVERRIDDVSVVGVHHSNSVYFVETSDSKDTAWVFLDLKETKSSMLFDHGFGYTTRQRTPFGQSIPTYHDGWYPYHERYEKSFLTKLLFELANVSNFLEPNINDSTLILDTDQTSFKCVLKDKGLMETLDEQFSNSLDESSVKYMALSQEDRKDPKSSVNPRVKFEFFFFV